MPVELAGGTAPEGELDDKVFVLAHGMSGVGKSDFALSFPPDFDFLNCDRAIGQLSKTLPTDVKINYEPIRQDVDRPTVAVAKQHLAKMDALLNTALRKAKLALAKDERPGTFILDGADFFWEYVRIALVPNYLSDDDNLPKEWADANAYMDNVLQRLGASPINVVFTVFSKPVWTGAKTKDVNDRVQSTGYKHMERWLTHEVYMFSPEDRTKPEETPKANMLVNGKNVGRPAGQSHYSVITRSKFNESLINRLIPNLSYSMLYRLTFGVPYPESERLHKPGTNANKVEEPEESE